MFRIRFVRVLLTASILTLGVGGAGLMLTHLRAVRRQQPRAQGPAVHVQRKLRAAADRSVSGQQDSRELHGTTGAAPIHVGRHKPRVAPDPAAAPLFSGQVASLAGLMSLLTALKEIDLASAASATSSASGTLSTTWTVPTFQALDPNASCPPTQQEFNSGLLGCALAMIDLSSFTPVGAGSALFEYSGFPLFPPNPTVALRRRRLRRDSPCLSPTRPEPRPTGGCRH